MFPRLGLSQYGLFIKQMTFLVRREADNTLFRLAKGSVEVLEEATDERHRVKGQRGLLSDMLAIPGLPNSLRVNVSR